MAIDRVYSECGGGGRGKNDSGGKEMIARSDVKQVGLKRARTIFVVAGYERQLGYFPAHRKRTFKTYQNALKYSIVLRDYYQAPVVEWS